MEDHARVYHFSRRRDHFPDDGEVLRTRYYRVVYPHHPRRMASGAHRHTERSNQEQGELS